MAEGNTSVACSECFIQYPVAVHASRLQQCMHAAPFQSNSQCLQGMMTVKASTSQVQVPILRQCYVTPITGYAITTLAQLYLVFCKEVSDLQHGIVVSCACHLHYNSTVRLCFLIHNALLTPH